MKLGWPQSIITTPVGEMHTDPMSDINTLIPSYSNIRFRTVECFTQTLSKAMAKGINRPPPMLLGASAEYI